MRGFSRCPEYWRLLGAATLVFCALTAASCAPNAERVEEKADVAAYYAPVEGLRGEALRAALQDLIDDHRVFSYKQVWDQLAYTDEDPARPGHVILLYTGRSEPISNRDRGQNDPESWNREHVWAKSHGFPDKAQAAYTDIHHLRPADRSVNSSRSDKDFDDSDAPHREVPDGWADRDSFEPPDRVKGDVARMLFYMDVRYDGSDSSGDLVLVNADSARGTPELGYLCTLIAWHALDPVDEPERIRNDRIHERQGNRNPFIDRPSDTAELWSEACP